MAITVSTTLTPAKVKLYWGAMPLPAGADALGTVTRDGCDTGILIRLASGVYVQGNAGSIRTLPAGDVEQALSRSAAGQAMRAIPSEARSQASRDNGANGGRPPKDVGAYLLRHPCPECHQVDVIVVDGILMGTCECADRPWSWRDVPTKE